MKTLADIINEARATRAQQSVYGPMATAIAGINPYDSSSKGKNLAQALLQGLLVGGLSGYEQRRERETDAALAQLIPQALAGQQLVMPEGMNESVFNKVAGDLAVFKAMRDLEKQDRKDLVDEEIRRTTEIEKAKALAPLITREERKKLLGESTAAPLGTVLQGTPSTSSNLQTKTYQQKLAEKVNELLDTGEFTMAQANEAARASLSGELAQNKEDLKKLAERQAVIDQAERLSAEVERAAPLATQSGPGGKTLQFVYGASQLPIVGDLLPEWMGEKYKAGEVLESQAAGIVAAAREAGVGAMSDAEMNMYLKSGPGLQFTPQTNLELAAKAKDIAKVGREYLEFKRNLMSQGVSALDVEIEYQRYKSEHPHFISDNTGNLVLNRTRPSPMEWATGKVSKPAVVIEESSSVGPSIRASETTIPSVGSIYNGERVVSVRRIK